jgi:hypothetical protein
VLGLGTAQRNVAGAMVIAAMPTLRVRAVRKGS